MLKQQETPKPAILDQSSGHAEKIAKPKLHELLGTSRNRHHLQPTFSTSGQKQTPKEEDDYLSAGRNS